MKLLLCLLAFTNVFSMEVSIADLIQVYELGARDGLAEHSVGEKNCVKHGPQDNNCLAAIAEPRGNLKYVVVNSYDACVSECQNYPDCNGLTYQKELKRCWVFVGVEEWKDCGKNKYRKSEWYECTEAEPAPQPAEENCVLHGPEDDNCLAAIAEPRGSLKYVVVNSYDACVSECDNYPDCNGLTYQKELKRCWVFVGVEEWKGCGKNKYRRSQWKECTEVAPTPKPTQKPKPKPTPKPTQKPKPTPKPTEKPATCEAQQYLDMGYTCEQLEGAGWDMGPCTCPVVNCAAQVLMNQGYTCEQLVAAGHDVTGCGCEDTCQYVCKTYMEQGFSCQECEMAGLQCVPCDECGGCQCQKYLDQGYACDQIEAAGLDCSGCDCGTCAAQAYVQMGYDCVHLKQAGIDVTGCGCDDVCACQEYLDRANEGYTCELLEGNGMDCSACECDAVCTDSCKSNLAQGLTCDQLQSQYGIDCSACDCTPKCTDTCQQYLAHYSCKKMMSDFGIDCSGCGECSCSQCGAYLTGYSCDALESSYGMNCDDCTSC